MTIPLLYTPLSVSIFLFLNSIKGLRKKMLEQKLPSGHETGLIQNGIYSNLKDLVGAGWEGLGMGMGMMVQDGLNWGRMGWLGYARWQRAGLVRIRSAGMDQAGAGWNEMGWDGGARDGWAGQDYPRLVFWIDKQQVM